MSPLYGGWVDKRVQSSRDSDLQPSCPHSEDMIKASCDLPVKRWEETADWPSAWHVQLQQEAKASALFSWTRASQSGC